MATNDEGEDIGVVVGALFGFFVLVFGISLWKGSPAPVAPAKATTEAEIAPVGDALAKVYFEVGQAALNDADQAVVSQTMAALALNPKAIVLLSGFHDPSGDPARNAELAKGRAEAVRDALVAGGVAADRVRFRKPESTVGTGSAEEGRRVEIRVQ
ncbi:MAG: OmpA family protein [Dechloromonas sp.]|uniref:OmpA family protein n=1 Tax=Candidatus Dechloromonas phosphorivorans TaxID=2899244 RepID=A0A935MQ23_9RHOO|nr:OmpA family protein [Candidatus Dechloromonas phosphorivorans]